MFIMYTLSELLANMLKVFRITNPLSVVHFYAVKTLIQKLLDIR
jgi:hypothetical protein